MQVVQYLKGIMTVDVPKTFKIAAKIDNAFCTAVCKIVSEEKDTFVGIAKGRYLKILMYKGDFIPLGLPPQVGYIRGSGTCIFNCNCDFRERQKYLDAIERMTYNYWNQFNSGYPVRIDTNNTASCKIELINKRINY
jgi:hypothetical protein